MDPLSFEEILSSPAPREEKAKHIAEKIRAVKDYHWVGIYDVREKEIALIAYSGRTEPTFTSFPRDKGLNGRAVTQEKTIVVNDISSDEDYLLTFSNTESEIIVPVKTANGTIVGTIDVESVSKNAFDKEDESFLETCAKSIASFWQ